MILNLVKVARLQFLVAGLALFVFGALVAVLLGAPFSWARLLLGALVILPAQLAVNLSNDYFDVHTDQPGGPTLISGGSSVLLQHPELRDTVKWLAIGCTAFSLLMGLVFIRIYSYPSWFMVIAVLGNLVGWMYSTPPFRLSHRGLGELAFTFVVGFLVPLTGYLSMWAVFDAGGILFLIPVILYGLVFILSVEIPDLEDDLQGNKRTWVARLGRGFGLAATGSLLLGATLYFFTLARMEFQHIPVDFRTIGWLSLLPLLPGLWGLVRRPLERQPATLVATLQVLTLAAFTILVDGYLFLAAL